MLSFLPAPLKGALALLLVIANLLFWCVPFYLVALVKFAVPVAGVRERCLYLLTRLAENWISGNRAIMHVTQRISWEIDLPPGLDYRGWYLVSSNHQSWTDIVVLQFVFNRRIPFLKFFLKRQLIWVPVLGLAWWALDLPFMHRHSRQYLEKHPELRGSDLETTRKACEHFRLHPTSVMIFPEGTRFTPTKRAAQDVPYRYLLRPRAGGLAYVVAAMGDTFRALLDVTICYPDGRSRLWDLLSGHIPRVVVSVRQREIPADLFEGDYLDDSDYRQRFQVWVSALWLEKDALLAAGCASDRTAKTSDAIGPR